MARTQPSPSGHAGHPVSIDPLANSKGEGVGIGRHFIAINVTRTPKEGGTDGWKRAGGGRRCGLNAQHAVGAR